MHERIEHIVLSACDFYGVRWQDVFKPHVTHLNPAGKAKSAIYRLITTNITTSNPWELLEVSSSNFRNALNYCNHDDCRRIQDIIDSKTLVYKKVS